MKFHDNLDSTCFHQVAAEYEALCTQLFRFALRQAKDNLANISHGKTACVILDLDETLLDNSASGARLIRDGQPFIESGNWKDWCNERKTQVVPGARTFVDGIVALGVQPIYVTSRLHAEVREATKADLGRHGFPLIPSDDPMHTNLFMKKMGTVVVGNATWSLQNKYEQRQFFTSVRNYEVILNVGDNLSDWEESYHHSHAMSDRLASLRANVDRLGQEFVLLPNPMYGSWQIALNNDFPGPSLDGPVTAAENAHMRALRFEDPSLA